MPDVQWRHYLSEKRIPSTAKEAAERGTSGDVLQQMASIGRQLSRPFYAKMSLAWQTAALGGPDCQCE